MGKSSTMARDVRDFKPQVGERVLVWHPRIKCWVIAYYLYCGEFEEWHMGRSKVVRLARWWMPEPEPPPGEPARGVYRSEYVDSQSD